MPALTLAQALDLAIQHHQAGRLGEAEGLYRQILAVDPNHADALNLLGLIAQVCGSPQVAAGLIRQAIAVQPFAAHYHFNLGNTLKDQGRFAEAIAAFQHALHLQPDLAIAHVNLGNTLREDGQFDEAIAAFQRALTLQPDLAEAHNNLGNSLQSLHQLDRAITAFRRAIELQPGYAMAHCNLGNALRSQSRLDEAGAALRRAIELQPDFALAHNNLGHVRKEQGRPGEAIALYRRALLLAPDSALALNNLGIALMEQGSRDEAIACFERVLLLAPDVPALHSNLLANLHYRTQATLRGIFEAHCEFDRRHAAPLRDSWPLHHRTADPQRPLRLGFISPHFARHAVGHFLTPLLEHLDREQFQIFCYSDSVVADAMTARIRATATAWHEVTALRDHELALKIREDAVDILFDLAGHTAGNRLLVFARKPAPIQVTWCDYVGTTGLAAIDYLLADPRQIPPEAEPWIREKVLRMPDDYICYDPPATAPPVGPLPAIESGSFTFGSFNVLPKITPEIIAVWARILHRLPHARLLLKNRGLDDPSTAACYRQPFAAHGIAEDRVELLGWSPPDEVLACYQRVDLALDTAPYNGGQTTCEALWMGVPVVTCPGETFASRHGLTHLTAAGFTETIARDFDEYVDLAVALANDLPRLAAIRARLRGQMAASPLCDGPRFAAHFAALMQEVWRR